VASKMLFGRWLILLLSHPSRRVNVPPVPDRAAVYAGRNSSPR
jgi:hypothetical protein